MGANPEIEEQQIIFFDGVCNLCNSSVNFVIDRDSREIFAFATLQSQFAKEQLGQTIAPDQLESVVLLKKGRIYTQSDAALEIARGLGGAWSLFYGFKLVPRPIRDWVYRWVARNRYRWFGKLDSCRVPTPELKSRFLDSRDVA